MSGRSMECKLYMEFSSRGFQRSAATPTPEQSPAPNNNRPIHKKAAQKLRGSKAVTSLWVVFFAALTVLVIALILSISTKSSETGLVGKDQYQAVFLSNGQAYFGKIKTLNNSYIDLRDVYYLYNGSSSQDQTAANLSLVKLGTELHCPKDQMVIYRDQVSFWENINADGKVATAIKNWKDQNKNGQKCSTASQQNTQQQSTSPQQTSDQTPSNTGTNGTDTTNNGAAGNGSANGSTNP